MLSPGSIDGRGAAGEEIMRGVMRFHKGVLKSPLAVRLWLMLLVAANGVAPLFFWDRCEARIVLGTLMFSGALMMLLTWRFGFTRLLGLGHLPWFVLLCYLWSRLDAMPAGTSAGMWVRAVMVLNAISLAIDVIDVIRYARGERAETVEGLD